MCRTVFLYNIPEQSHIALSPCPKFQSVCVLVKRLWLSLSAGELQMIYSELSGEEKETRGRPEVRVTLRVNAFKVQYGFSAATCAQRATCASWAHFHKQQAQYIHKNQSETFNLVHLWKLLPSRF